LIFFRDFEILQNFKFCQNFEFIQIQNRAGERSNWNSEAIGKEKVHHKVNGPGPIIALLGVLGVLPHAETPL
jgi:hypothetical protein